MPTEQKVTGEKNSDQQTSVVRVGISEAAKLFGVSPRTVRRAVSNGELRYIVVRNRYQIHFESLVNWSQKQTTVQKKRDQQGIGQWIEKWKIKNPKYSPRTPEAE